MVQSPRIGAVVLAGGHVPATLAHLCDHRALLQLNGRYLLDYLLETLQAMPSVVATAIVAPAEALPSLSALPGYRVAAGASIVENMQRGANALIDEKVTHLLFVTGDIPLVTPEGLENYIRNSLASRAALTYPIIPREASEIRFPGARRTYVRLREGTFTGGNAIFATANLLDDKAELIQGLYAARKQPVKLAKLLGLGTVLRLLTGTITLPYIEAVATRILGAPARAIISPHPEIGFDVDKLDDLVAVERALAEKSI
ncbi:MAG: NTP transferase domain-containing protein [Armatimonadota bacterium]